MKISVIIATILVAQVSASFFDVFHGAVLSVQNSFGKLLSDVVTDVKETVDCTILAVEHVLSLSHDATTRYYDKCSSGTNKTDSVSEAPQDALVPKVEVTLNLPNNNEEYLQKVIPAEIDARINERLSKVLGNYKPHDNVNSIQNLLAKESEQLAGVSVIVKKELEKLSNEVTTDLKKIEKQRDSQPSVDTILQEIKVLEKREQISKNASEAKEIHQVIDQVLGKLNAIEATEATENVKLEEILKDLENNSNNTFVGFRNQFEEWKEEEARHLSEIKSKIEEHENIAAHHHGSYNSYGSDQIQPVLFYTDMNRDNEPISSSPEILSKNTTLVKEVLDNTTYSRMIADSIYKSTIPVADETSSLQNKTLEDSRLNDTVMTSYSYFNTKSSIGSELFQPFESPTVVRSSEFSTLSTNESTTTTNNLTGYDTKLTIAALSITESTFVNESIQSVDSIRDSDKQEMLPKNYTISILSFDENNNTQSVIPIQTPEITAIEDVTLPFKSNTDSGKKQPLDSTTANDTVIAVTSVTDIITTSQNNNNSNVAANSNIANPVVENTSVNTTGSENEAFSILPSYELATTLETFDDIQSTETMITSTHVNETNKSIENSTTTGNLKSTHTATTVNDYDYNEIKIPSKEVPTFEITPVSETMKPIENTTASSRKESPMTIIHDNILKDIIITSTSLSIVENTPVHENIQTEGTSTTSSDNTTICSDSSTIFGSTTVSQITESVETITAPGIEESVTASTSLPIIENTPVSYTIEEKTTVSTKEESTETVTEWITTSKIEINSFITVTSTPIPSINTDSETIEAVYTTIVSSSEEEALDSTATEISNTVDDDDGDSSATVVTSTAETISERTPEENIAESENDEMSTTNSPNTSPATSVDTDSDTDSVTSTTFQIPEIKTASEIIDLGSTTPTQNEENLILSKTPPATISDEVTNENTETKDNVTSDTENTDNTVVTETIQTVQTNTAAEEQDLPSTSTQSAINVIVSTSTAFPSTERTSESIMISKNEVDLRNSPTFTPDLNVIKGPLLTIRESPPVNRDLLKPNIIPVYDQPAMPPISRGLFNEAQKQERAFAIFDTIDKRLSHSGSPFGPEEDIPIANIPSTPLLANAPWKPIDPRKMNFENPFKPPLQPIRPLPFDETVRGNAYRPQGLTTHRPRNANNYKNPSIDYDSFFHTPPRNSEAYQRVLKEARQIMANGKRSDRFINNIMKNKNKFNARSIFNG